MKEEIEKMLSPLDFVLLYLGRPGRYQIFIAFLLCSLQLPISFSFHLWKYYADDTPHRCSLRSEMLNGTRDSEWIPYEKRSDTDLIESYSSCTMYIDAHNHWKGRQQCIFGWEFKPLENERNIIIEWNLVCERKYLLHLLNYISILSSILGSFIFGSLADRFERKYTLLVALYLFVSVSLSIHFTQDFLTFAILYCLQMLFTSGLVIISYTLLIEILPTPFQLQASLYFILFALLSTTLFPIIVSIIKSWRYIQLALVAPGIVFFTHLWILPQSPVWLVSKEKLTETENLIESLATQNGAHVPPNFRLHIQYLKNIIKNSNEVRKDFLSTFSSSHLRWYLFVHFYLFFVTTLMQSVTESQILRLHESKYADHFFRCLVDIGTFIILYQFAIRCGPRPTQALVFIISGLLMMVAIALQEVLPKNPDQIEKFDYRLLLLPSTLVSGARTLVKTLPAFIWYHTVKTLPTSVRVIGLASCYSWSLIAEMASPNLLILADLIAPFVPLGLSGSLAVIAGAVTLLFPNCWRKPLPNTIEEVENRAFILAKNRYPSFREIKDNSDAAFKFPIDSIVYTCDPVFETTDVKYKESIEERQEQHHNDQVLTEDSKQQIFFDDINTGPLTNDGYQRENWRLRSNSFQKQMGNESIDVKKSPRKHRHHHHHHHRHDCENSPDEPSNAYKYAIAETNL